MKFQTYYNTPFEIMADVCDMTKELCINCVGAVDDTLDISTRDIRNDYYMMYVIKGGMKIKFGDFDGSISAGQLLIMKPGTEYMYNCERERGLNYLWIHFTGNMAEKMVCDAGILFNEINNCGYISEVVECWRRMCTEFVINDDYFAQATKSIFNEILIGFSRRINKSDERNRLIKSTSYIYENYQKKISIEFLADMENLSQSHYRAIFTRTLGESPVEYIISRRIEAAIYLLNNSDKKLSEIAELVGYNDVYYFNRQFKRKTGVSPGKYRKNKQNNI